MRVQYGHAIMAHDAGMSPVNEAITLERKDKLIARYDLRLNKGVAEDERLAEALKEIREKRHTGSVARTLRVLVFEEVDRIRTRSTGTVKQSK